jgi:hypothetical protein
MWIKVDITTNWKVGIPFNWFDSNRYSCIGSGLGSALPF